MWKLVCILPHVISHATNHVIIFHFLLFCFFCFSCSGRIGLNLQFPSRGNGQWKVNHKRNRTVYFHHLTVNGTRKDCSTMNEAKEARPIISPVGQFSPTTSFGSSDLFFCRWNVYPVNLEENQGTWASHCVVTVSLPVILTRVKRGRADQEQGWVRVAVGNGNGSLDGDPRKRKGFEKGIKGISGGKCGFKCPGMKGGDWSIKLVNGQDLVTD